MKSNHKSRRIVFDCVCRKSEGLGQFVRGHQRERAAHPEPAVFRHQQQEAAVQPPGERQHAGRKRRGVSAQQQVIAADDTTQSTQVKQLKREQKLVRNRGPADLGKKCTIKCVMMAGRIEIHLLRGNWSPSLRDIKLAFKSALNKKQNCKNINVAELKIHLIYLKNDFNI